MIDHTNKKLLSGYNFIDLFAGIGGFRIALESFGAKCIFSSEWDRHAQYSYMLNFGDCPEGDITQIDETKIPAHDILCAGFPCQAFSISGKQKGFEDSRGTLFFDVARIVKAKKPKIVFLENVKNFESHDAGKTLHIVKSTLNELGYTFFYKVLNAIDYGIPQKRERIYMVAFSEELNVQSFKFPKKIILDKCVEDFLMTNDIEHLYVLREDILINKTISNKKSNKTIRVGIVNKGGQGERIYSPKGVAITFSAHGGGVFSKTGGYLINGRPRKLHKRECANLMGYPQDFQLHPSDSQAYKQLGNSVVVDVLQYITQEFAHMLTQ